VRLLGLSTAARSNLSVQGWLEPIGRVIRRICCQAAASYATTDREVLIHLHDQLVAAGVPLPAAGATSRHGLGA
jgi:hypothetical protein